MDGDGERWSAFDALAECTGALVSVLDGEGNVLYWSRNHAAMLGLSPAARGYRPTLEQIHPDDRARVAEFQRALLEAGGGGSVTYRLARADRRLLWMRTQAGKHTLPDGSVRAIGLTQDVSAQVAADEILRDSQEKYRLLAEGASDVLWIMGPDLKTRYMSPAVKQQLGYTAEEYLAMPLEERLPPESLRLVRETFGVEHARALELAKEQAPHAFTMEMLHRHKDGRTAWGEVRAAFMYDPAWNIVGIHGVTRNVDDRRRAQEALKRSEEYYRRLFQETRDGLAVCDVERDGDGAIVDFTVAEVNRSYELHTGFPPAAVLGRKASAYFPPAELARILPILEEVFQGTTHREERHIPGLDRRIDVACWALSPDRFVTMFEDVTGRRRTEEALERSERHYRTFFQEIRAAMALCDAVRDEKGRLVDFVYREINPAYSLHTGLPAERVTGHRASEIFPPAEVARRLETLVPVLEGKVFREECWFGSLGRWFDATFWSQTPDSFVIMFEDVTSRRRMEEEVVRAQKLESVGLLAGGIAHDFNNILTGILGNISLVRMLADQDPRLQPLLESAEDACGRARDLTQQLLTFSRGGDPVKADVPLPEVLRKAADFVLAGSNVSCIYRLAPSGLTAPMDRGQIAQVVQNLVLNAIQAMPDGGHMEISADRVDLSEGSVPTLAAGPYVRFSVKDEGHGIEDRHKGKLFDPYFTTRPDGQGLGLPVSFSIVRKHGGSIEVDTAVGRGSTFTVYLPAACAGARMARGGEDPRYGPRRGRVLVMDDDASVREVMGRMLSLLGYEAASVRDGTEAVQMYQRHLQQGARFDLVLMDLTVPGGMGGRAAIREILALDPGARAIVMSGYSNDPVMADHTAHGFRGVLPKPVKMPDLRDAVARLLAEGD